MSTREHINEYFNGRPFALLCALALMAMSAVALSSGLQPPTGHSAGIFFTLKDELIESGPLAVAANLLCMLAIGGIMLAVNKVYNFVRSVTHLFVSSFFLLQLANPWSLATFNVGSLLVLVSALSILPLFASYQDRHSQRNVFVIFAMIATGCMFHYAFLILIPAFCLGFLYMGVFNFKGVLAMLFGLITPFWIVLGLGLVSPADFNPLQLNGIWQLIGQPDINRLLLLAVATAATGIILAVSNLFTIMNYRKQTRVYNYYFVVLLVATVIALCVNYLDVAVYLPLLNLSVAVQVAQAHTLKTSFHNRYILLLLFIAACVGWGASSLLLS